MGVRVVRLGLGGSGTDSGLDLLLLPPDFGFSVIFSFTGAPLVGAVAFTFRAAGRPQLGFEASALLSAGGATILLVRDRCAVPPVVLLRVGAAAGTFTLGRAREPFGLLSTGSAPGLDTTDLAFSVVLVDAVPLVAVAVAVAVAPTTVLGSLTTDVFCAPSPPVDRVLVDDPCLAPAVVVEFSLREIGRPPRFDSPSESGSRKGTRRAPVTT